MKLSFGTTRPPMGARTASLCTLGSLPPNPVRHSTSAVAIFEVEDAERVVELHADVGLLQLVSAAQRLGVLAGADLDQGAIEQIAGGLLEDGPEVDGSVSGPFRVVAFGSISEMKPEERPRGFVSALHLYEGQLHVVAYTDLLGLVVAPVHAESFIGAVQALAVADEAGVASC